MDADGMQASAAGAGSPLQSGALIVVTLSNPREKFWGAILALTAAGISLSGVELASFEDLVVMVKESEPVAPGVIFFPMHRVERIELDAPDGNIPSLSQRFQMKTGVEAGPMLLEAGRKSPGHSR